MGALQLINTVGNLIPHSGRRFILDRLGVGKVIARMTRNRADSAVLPNGMTIFYNPVMHWSGSDPAGHEPEVMEAIRSNLRPGSVFYDVGANIGYYCLIASSIVGRSGKVLAFEPGDLNVGLLRRNISQPGAENIALHPIALGRTDGTMTFDNRGAMSARLVGEGETAVNPVSVPVRSIDSLVAEGHPAPDVIKIDVEGGEGDVLEGAAETLKRRRPVVICEMHAWAPDGVRRAEAALQSAGYALRKIRMVTPSGHDEGYHVLAS